MKVPLNLVKFFFLNNPLTSHCWCFVFCFFWRFNFSQYLLGKRGINCLTLVTMVEVLSPLDIGWRECVTFLLRAIVWLQNKRDVALERSRPLSHRREEQHEFRVGRLKHERVKVPRGDEVNVPRNLQDGLKKGITNGVRDAVWYVICDMWYDVKFLLTISPRITH